MGLAILSYKVVSFDQFLMKLGIMPVSSVSDAHLRSQEVFPHILSQSFVFIFFIMCMLESLQLRKEVIREFLHYFEVL